MLARLTHLHLELGVGVFVHMTVGEAVGSVHDGLLLLPVGETITLAIGAVCTLLAPELGARCGGLGLDLVVGDCLGDDVLEELEIVMM